MTVAGIERSIAFRKSEKTALMQEVTARLEKAVFKFPLQED